MILKIVLEDLVHRCIRTERPLILQYQRTAKDANKAYHPRSKHFHMEQQETPGIWHNKQSYTESTLIY